MKRFNKGLSILSIALMLSNIITETGLLLVKAEEMNIQNQVISESESRTDLIIQDKLVNQIKTNTIIKAEDITIDKQEVSPGDTLTIKVNTSVDSEYSLQLNYRMPNNEYGYTNLYLNEDCTSYEGTIEITESSLNGLWKISTIIGYDSYENFYVYNTDINDSEGLPEHAIGLDLSDNDFTVSGGNDDFEGPQADLLTLKISHDVVNPRDMQLIQLKVTDKSEIYQVYLDYDIVASGEVVDSKSIHLYYNEETGYYESEYKITHNLPNGEWKLRSITTGDTHGNYEYYESKDSNSDSLVKYDLSSGNFRLEGAVPDYEAPIVDLSTLTIDKNLVALGDNVQVTVKATDRSEIASFSISYETGLGRYTSLEFKYNKESDLFEANMPITEMTHDGLWTATGLYITDDCDNYRSYYYLGDEYEEEVYDLSAANFTVKGGRTDISAPEVDLSSIKVSKKELSSGDKLGLSMIVTDATGISHVRVSYQYKTQGYTDNWFEFDLVYNESNKRFESLFKIPNDMILGDYELVGIEVIDIYGQREYLFGEGSGQNWETLYDFSAGTITVVKGNDEPQQKLPAIDDENISVEFTDSNVSIKQEGSSYFISNIASNVTKVQFVASKSRILPKNDENIITIFVKLSDDATTFMINGQKPINGQLTLDLESGINPYSIQLVDEDGDIVKEYNFKFDKMTNTGSQPGTGNGESDKPGTGNGESDKPGTGNGESDKPGTGNGESDKPGTGNGESDKPGTGNGESDKPGTGNGESDKPGTGNGESDKPGTGNGESDKLGTGNGESDKPETGFTALIILGSGLLLSGLGTIMLLNRRKKC